MQFTYDPKVLYTLDYTTIGGSDLQRPSRSGDGGLTWTALASDPIGGEACGVWADTASTQRLIVNNYDSIFFSSNGESTWNTVYTNQNNGSGVRIAGMFWDGADIFIGTNAGVIVSNNNGLNFAIASLTGIPSAQNIVSFTGGKTGNTRRFACATITKGCLQRRKRGRVF